MRNLVAIGLLAGLAASSMGCRFIARGPDKYRDDTRALLESNSSSLKACYDGIIAGDKAAVGTVTVKFTVALETGAIQDVRVDETNSTAPAGVQDCVTNSIQGLALDPPDARDGKATFTYEFEVAPQAAPTS
jgi:hypothetical protein